MNDSEIEELSELADEILVEEDPRVLADHIADSIEEWLRISGCSTRDAMWMKNELRFWRNYANV